MRAVPSCLGGNKQVHACFMTATVPHVCFDVVPYLTPGEIYIVLAPTKPFEIDVISQIPAPFGGLSCFSQARILLRGSAERSRVPHGYGCRSISVAQQVSRTLKQRRSYTLLAVPNSISFSAMLTTLHRPSVPCVPYVYCMSRDINLRFPPKV